ncbi:hypothetical protein LTR10_007086 [Elasticomyces elasticus]|nr:hypothetical protein LTR10_007086 [Elasticomyces elasticus]KAK4978904.1 hypothetical protein LTR42_001404 [Elasticomyces elasticus]
MTGQSDKNSGLTSELTLGNLHTATQAVCDDTHKGCGSADTSKKDPASLPLSSPRRIACDVRRRRRIRCSHKSCTECRERNISCAHPVAAESENTVALFSSLSFESKNSVAFSSTSAQEAFLPDAGSSEPRFPAGDLRVEMETGPLMRRRTMFIPRDSEGTLYLESGPSTSSDDEDPRIRAGKEMDRLLDSVAKQRKEQRNRPMLYVYLGPGTGQADDREKPLRLQDMIRRQVDQHESKVDEGWTSHLCDRTVATNEA